MRLNTLKKDLSQAGQNINQEQGLHPFDKQVLGTLVRHLQGEGLSEESKQGLSLLYEQVLGLPLYDGPGRAGKEFPPPKPEGQRLGGAAAPVAGESADERRARLVAAIAGRR